MNGEDELDLARVEERLGVRFADRELLRRALTHSSFRHERREGGDYERLEFLGDSVLGFLVAEWLVADDPDSGEGELTRRKQAVVRAETLSRTAEAIGLGAFLRLGRGEERTGGRSKPSLLADVFEAVLGAVLLDRGLRGARAFVKRHLGADLRATRQGSHAVTDFKTRLQEAVQAELRVTPRYRIVSTSGPSHASRFVAEVVIGDQVAGRGHGTTRKQAEQRAAESALDGRERTGDHVP